MPRLHTERTEVDIKHLREVDLPYYKEKLVINPNDDEALDMVVMILRIIKNA